MTNKFSDCFLSKEQEAFLLFCSLYSYHDLYKDWKKLPLIKALYLNGPGMSKIFTFENGQLHLWFTDATRDPWKGRRLDFTSEEAEQLYQLLKSERQKQHSQKLEEANRRIRELLNEIDCIQESLKD